MHAQPNTHIYIRRMITKKKKNLPVYEPLAKEKKCHFECCCFMAWAIE